MFPKNCTLSKLARMFDTVSKIRVAFCVTFKRRDVDEKQTYT